MNKKTMKMGIEVLTVGLVFSWFAVTFTGCSDKKSPSSEKSAEKSVSENGPAEDEQIHKEMAQNPYSALFGVWELTKESAEVVRKDQSNSADLLLEPNALVYVGPKKFDDSILVVSGIDRKWIRLNSKDRSLRKLQNEEFDFKADVNAELPIQMKKTFSLTSGLGDLEIHLESESSLPGNQLKLILKSNVDEKSLILKRSNIDPKTGRKYSLIEQLSRYQAQSDENSAKLETDSMSECQAKKPGQKFEWLNFFSTITQGNVECASASLGLAVKGGWNRDQLVSRLLVPIVANSGDDANRSWGSLTWAINAIKNFEPLAFSDDRYAGKIGEFNGGRSHLWGYWSNEMVRSSSQISSHSLLSSLIENGSSESPRKTHKDNLMLKDMILEKVVGLRWEHPNSSHTLKWSAEPFFLIRTTYRLGLIEVLSKDLQRSTLDSEATDNICDGDGGYQVSWYNPMNLEVLKRSIIKSDSLSAWDTRTCESPTHFYYRLFLEEPRYLADERVLAYIKIGLVPSASDYYFPRMMKNLGGMIFKDIETIRKLWGLTPEMSSEAAMQNYLLGSQAKIESLKNYAQEVAIKGNQSKESSFQNVLVYQQLTEAIEGVQQTRAMVESVVNEIKAGK